MLRRELQHVRKRVPGHATRGSVVAPLEDLAREEPRVDPVPRASTNAVRHAEHSPLVVIEEGVLAALGRLLGMWDRRRTEDGVQAVGGDQGLPGRRDDGEHARTKIAVELPRA